jgi:hypothetical protein
MTNNSAADDKQKSEQQQGQRQKQRQGQTRPQVLRLGRSQSARTASLRMTIFEDVVEGYEVFSGLARGFADDPGGHAALVLDYGGFDGVD